MQTSPVQPASVPAGSAEPDSARGRGAGAAPRRAARSRRAGQARGDPTLVGRAALGWSPPPRRRPRRRQDPAREGARPLDRRQLPAGPGHPRSAPERAHGRVRARRESPGLGVPARAAVRQRRPRRRGEPGDAPNPVRAARGDGGAAGHRRRHHALAPRTVLPRRDPEPVRARRDVPAGRGPARPLRGRGADGSSRPGRRNAISCSVTAATTSWLGSVP